MNRLVGLVVVLLVMQGCATRAPVIGPEAEQNWQHRKELLSRQELWQLNGRVAVWMGEDGWQATLIWQQRADAYQLRLIAPLGQGVVEMRGDDGYALLRDTEGNIHTAENREELIYRHLGWRLPVTGLHYWVLGIPSPAGVSETRIDAMGRLEYLQQAGWDIHYDRYKTVDALDLPARILLENDEIRVRLVIDQWQLG